MATQSTSEIPVVYAAIQESVRANRRLKPATATVILALGARQSARLIRAETAASAPAPKGLAWSRARRQERDSWAARRDTATAEAEKAKIKLAAIGKLAGAETVIGWDDRVLEMGDGRLIPITAPTVATKLEDDGVGMVMQVDRLSLRAPVSSYSLEGHEGEFTVDEAVVGVVQDMYREAAQRGPNSFREPAPVPAT